MNLFANFSNMGKIKSVFSVVPCVLFTIFLFLTIVAKSSSQWTLTRFDKREIYSNQFEKIKAMDKKMVEGVCVTQCAFACNTEIDCSAFKCEGGNRCVLGKYLLASQAGAKCNSVSCVEFEVVYISHDRYEQDKTDGACVSRTKSQPCDSIKDRGTCLTSTDSRNLEIDGVQLSGSNCHWCPDGPCTSHNANRCEPEPFLISKGVKDYETCMQGSTTTATTEATSTTTATTTEMTATTTNKQQMFKTEFALLYDNGSCRGPEKQQLSGCNANGIKPLIDCGVACKSIKSCLAFIYNKVDKKCLLITMWKMIRNRHCPNGYKWKDQGLVAKSVEDFKKWPNADLVCYAKINVDENERR